MVKEGGERRNSITPGINWSGVPKSKYDGPEMVDRIREGPKLTIAMAMTFLVWVALFLPAASTERWIPSNYYFGALSRIPDIHHSFREILFDGSIDTGYAEFTSIGPLDITVNAANTFFSTLIASLVVVLSALTSVFLLLMRQGILGKISKILTIIYVTGLVSALWVAVAGYSTVYLLGNVSFSGNWVLLAGSTTSALYLFFSIKDYGLTGPRALGLQLPPMSP